MQMFNISVMVYFFYSISRAIIAVRHKIYSFIMNNFCIKAEAPRIS